MIQSISSGDMQTTKLTPLHFVLRQSDFFFFSNDIFNIDNFFFSSWKTDFYHGATL